MSDKTATQVMVEQEQDRQRNTCLRHALQEKISAEYASRLRRPQVVVMGFEDYLLLKMEVMSSCAEVLSSVDYAPFKDCTTGPQPTSYSLLYPLNTMGIECFAWNGILVGQLKSVPHGTFFL